MRRIPFAILFAVVPLIGGGFGVARAQDGPTSIYTDPQYTTRELPSQNGSQSIYEKVRIGQPLPRQGPAQKDLEDARQKFDDAAAALDKAREDAVTRLRADPRIAPLEQSLATAKVSYDDEIEDALSAMSYQDEYQDLIAATDKAGQALDFIARNSPDDARSIAAAQQHFDQARQAVEDFEDGTLDNDSYVQAARKTFLATRDVRDRTMDAALNEDLAVKSAQAAVDQQKQTVDEMTAQLQNSGNNTAITQAPRDADRYSNQPPPEPQAGYDDSAGNSAPAPVYDDGSSGDQLADNGGRIRRAQPEPCSTTPSRMSRMPTPRGLLRYTGYYGGGYYGAYSTVFLNLHNHDHHDHDSHGHGHDYGHHSYGDSYSNRRDHSDWRDRNAQNGAQGPSQDSGGNHGNWSNGSRRFQRPLCADARHGSSVPSPRQRFAAATSAQAQTRQQMAQRQADRPRPGRSGAAPGRNINRKCASPELSAASGTSITATTAAASNNRSRNNARNRSSNPAEVVAAVVAVAGIKPVPAVRTTPTAATQAAAGDRITDLWLGIVPFDGNDYAIQRRRQARRHSQADARRLRRVHHASAGRAGHPPSCHGSIHPRPGSDSRRISAPVQHRPMTDSSSASSPRHESPA